MQDETAGHVLPSPCHSAADFGLSELAAALAAIIAVGAFAPAGTRVVGTMAQLAHVLDHHLHAMRVAFRQVPARKIAGQFVIDLQPSPLDEFARFARAAEAIRFELDQGGESESIVTGDEVHVAMRNTSHAECTLPTVVPGDVV